METRERQVIEMDEVLRLCESTYQELKGIRIPERVSENGKILNLKERIGLESQKNDLAKKLSETRTIFNKARQEGWATHGSIVQAIQDTFYQTEYFRDRYRSERR